MLLDKSFDGQFTGSVRRDILHSDRLPSVGQCRSAMEIACQTDMEYDTVIFNWKVNNFQRMRAMSIEKGIPPEGDVITSPIYVDVQGGQWWLRLYPYEEREEHKGKVSLFLHTDRATRGDVYFSFHFSALSEAGLPIEDTAGGIDLHKFEQSEAIRNFGFYDLIESNEVIEKALIDNHALWLFCEVHIFSSLVTSLDEVQDIKAPPLDRDSNNYIREAGQPCITPTNVASPLARAIGMSPNFPYQEVSPTPMRPQVTSSPADKKGRNTGQNPQKISRLMKERAVGASISKSSSAVHLGQGNCFALSASDCEGGMSIITSGSERPASPFTGTMSRLTAGLPTTASNSVTPSATVSWNVIPGYKVGLAPLRHAPTLGSAGLQEFMTSPPRSSPLAPMSSDAPTSRTYIASRYMSPSRPYPQTYTQPSVTLSQNSYQSSPATNKSVLSSASLCPTLPTTLTPSGAITSTAILSVPDNSANPSPAGRMYPPKTRPLYNRL